VKAAVFEGIEDIQIREIDRPKCDEDGIVVQVKSCGICGSDIRNFHAGLKGDITGQIMGHEIAGMVDEVGREVTRFHIGDRVAIAPDVSCGECFYCKRNLGNLCVRHRMIGTHWPGGFAEYLHLSREVLVHGMVHHMPESLSFEAAALSEPASSVLAAQHNAEIGLSDTVLIIGDGPIGCLHIEMARARGASRVFMVGLKRLKAAATFSPDALIDAATQNPVQEVLKLTDGLGADVAICANPVASTQEQAVEAVRKRGKVVLFGGVPRTSPLTTLNSNLIHYNELRILGAFSYPAYIHQLALKVIADGKITADRYLDHILSLDQILEGFRAAEAGEVLKVIINP